MAENRNAVWTFWASRDIFIDVFMEDPKISLMGENFSPHLKNEPEL